MASGIAAFAMVFWQNWGGELPDSVWPLLGPWIVATVTFSFVALIGALELAAPIYSALTRLGWANWYTVQVAGIFVGIVWGAAVGALVGRGPGNVEPIFSGLYGWISALFFLLLATPRKKPDVTVSDVPS